MPVYLGGIAAITIALAELFELVVQLSHQPLPISY